MVVRIYVLLKRQWNCVQNRKRKAHAMDHTFISILIEKSEAVCRVSDILLCKISLNCTQSHRNVKKDQGSLKNSLKDSGKNSIAVMQ